jgi:hypothetical protein
VITFLTLATSPQSAGYNLMQTCCVTAQHTAESFEVAGCMQPASITAIEIWSPKPYLGLLRRSSDALQYTFIDQPSSTLSYMH